MKKIIGGLILSLVLVVGFTVAVAAGADTKTVKVNGQELKGIEVVSVVDKQGKKVGWNVEHNDSLEVRENSLIITNKDKTEIIEGQKINVLQDGELKEVYNTLVASKEESKETLEIETVLTESTEEFNLSKGATAVKFTNNAYAYANSSKEGILYIYETDDDLIEFTDSKEFEKFLGIEGILNLIKTKNDTLEVKNILTQSTKDFYLEPGTVAVEFSNGSYAYTNTDLEGNKSYCYDNGKEIIEFNSKSELNNYLGIEIEL